MKSTQDSVEKWLNNHGVRLEYRTFAAMRRRFGHCRLGDHIASKDGILREIDVMAQLSHLELSRGYGFLLRFICECKYSKSKPWVLLYGNSDPSWLVTNWLGIARTSALEEMPKLSEQQAQELQRAFHFSEGIDLAHGVVEAHVDAKNCETGKRDAAFDSLRKISDAAWSFRDSLETSRTRWFGIVFPAVIVDAPLFAARFDEGSQRVRAKEVNYARLSWTGCDRGSTLVDIVRADALEEYAKGLDESFTTIMRVLRWFYEPKT